MRKLPSFLLVCSVAAITLFLTIFANAQSNGISIHPNNSVDPYPSTYTVSGLSGTIATAPNSVRVKINTFRHTSPANVAFMLESPTGARLMLQAGAGGTNVVEEVNYTFSDVGTNMTSAALANGAVYKPTALGALPVFPTINGTQGPFRQYNNPGPLFDDTASFSSTFGGTNPNGVWKLYALDNRTGPLFINGGYILGWSMEIATVNTPLAPTGGYYVGNDFTTKGNWNEKYGTQGYWIIGDVKNLPEWAQVSMTAPAYTWANSTTDVRALRKASNTNDRIAAAIYTANQTEIAFNFTDGRTHRVSFYIVDWDRNSRGEAFTMFNTETGELFDTSSADTFFGEGHYLTFQVSGNVKIRLNQVLGANAIMSGIFIDAPPAIDTSATFVGADAMTKGNWKGAYGAQTRRIIGDRINEISYKNLSVYGYQQHVWSNSTPDVRALQKTSESERIAGAYYASSQFGLIFDLPTPRRLALYVMDFDGTNRQQTFELVNNDTGAVLDTQTLSNFSGGRYLVWKVSGRFTVRVKNAKTTGNVVISGIFLDEPNRPLPVAVDSSASFVGFDDYSKGTWKTKYGTEGSYTVRDRSREPAYGSWNQLGMSEYTWAEPTTDERALQSTVGDTRKANTYYAPNEFTVDFTFTDTLAHRLAFYSLDWEGANRQQTFEVINTDTGVVMDTRTITNFGTGVYAVWQVKGKVTVRIKKISGPNAVVSGWFLDAAGTPLPPAPPPPPADPNTASFVRFDTNAHGNWLSNHGGQGYSIVNDATSLPAYAQMSITNQNAYSWNASTTDVRALIKPANVNDRIASTFYAPNQFELNFNLTDGNAHRIALYAIDWEGSTRQQTYELVKTDTGTILDTKTISNFNGGVYAIWDVKGKVTVRVKRVFGQNAVLSGIFFDSLTADETTGSFVGFNANAQGNWAGSFGSQGSLIINDATNLPTYTKMTAVGQNVYTWVQSTADVRALTKATNNADRIAATYYTPNQMDLSFYITDEQVHKLSIYSLDWDTNNTRSQTLELINTITGAVIDTRTINNFGGGVYTTWNVKGKVTVRVKKVTGPNAVVSGVFVDNP